MSVHKIREFLNMQLDAVEQADNTTDAGLLLVLMADYLLEWAEKQPEIFQNADEPKLRKIFLRVGSAEERIKNIYTEYHAPLAESAARIFRKIEENMETIQEKQQVIAGYDQAVSELENSVKSQEDLLAREEQLKERKTYFESVMVRIEECKKILEELTPELLAQKETEASGLQVKTDQRKAENADLDQKITSLKQELENQDKMKQALEEQITGLNENIEKLTARIRGLQEEQTRLEEAIRTYEKKAEELSEAVSKAGGVFAELKAELEENERLEAGILETGFFDPEDFKKHLKELKEQGDKLLKDYEEALGNILKDARALYKKIKERHHL